MPLSTPPRKKAEAFYPVFSGDAMWEIDSNLQILSFLYAGLAGGIFSVFYDVLKSVRLSFKCSAITVFFQDIFYFAVVAVEAFCFLLSQSGGEIRLYIIFGFILGFIILRLTFSRILVPVLSGVLKFILKIFRTVDKGFWKIIAALEGFFGKIFKKTASFLKNSKNRVKKLLKRPKGLLYTKQE